MISLWWIGKFRGQQIDNRRYFIMIPRNSKLFHYPFNLHNEIPTINYQNPKTPNATNCKNKIEYSKKGAEDKHQVQHFYASRRACQQGCEARLPESARERRPWQHPPSWELLDYRKENHFTNQTRFRIFSCSKRNILLFLSCTFLFLSFWDHKQIENSIFFFSG